MVKRCELKERKSKVRAGEREREYPIDVFVIHVGAVFDEHLHNILVLKKDNFVTR
jgi:hypothetical protein